MKPSALFPILSLLGSSTALPSRSSHLRRAAAHSHKLTHVPPASIAGPVFRPAGSAKSALAAVSAPESQKAGARHAGGNVTSASAVFAIPHAEMAAAGPTAGNQNGVYQASYWVGIDGVSASCGAASLRAGVDTFWDAGMRTTAAWYEWYPVAGPTDFANFTVAQGDVVRVRAEVTAADGSAGRVAVERLDGLGSGAAVLAAASWAFEGGAGAAPLCRGEAAWVIEDYPLVEQPQFPLALANFTEVTFERLEVDGRAVAGLEVFDINLEAQGGRLTDCEVGADGTSVGCKRVVGGV